MKLKIASAVLIAAIAGSAFAETPTVVKEPFVSTKSRADVQAEPAQYWRASRSTRSQSSGSMFVLSPPLAAFPSAGGS